MATHHPGPRVPETPDADGAVGRIGRPARATAVAVLAFASVLVAAAVTEPASGVTAGKHPSLALLDAKTGEASWSVATSRAQGLFYATPGTRVVVAGTGTCDESYGPFPLAAFDVESGRKLWTAPTATSAFTTLGQRSTPFANTVPVDARGIVVTLDGDGLVGRRAESGTVAWRGPTGRTTLGVSQDLVFTAGPGVDAAFDAIQALERSTGALRWERAGWNAEAEVVAADDRHVVVATGDLGRTPHGPISMVVLDARTGHESARFDVGDPTRFDLSEVALTDDLVVYAEGGSVVARRLTDGIIGWSVFRLFFPSLAVSPGDATVLAVTSEPQGAKTTALATSTGKVRWEAGDRYPVAVGDEVAIVRKPDSSPTLFAISTRSGAQRWHRAPPISEPWRQGIDAKVRMVGNRLAVSSTCEDG